MELSSDKTIDIERERDKNLGRMEGKLDLLIQDKRLDAFNRRQELRTRLNGCILATEKALTDKRVYEQSKQDKQDLQKDIENKIKIEIAEETLGDKKRYTNQEGRDSALAIRLNDHTEYQFLKKQYIEVMTELTKTYDLLEILKMKFRQSQAEVELEKLEI
jgi:hypothetical protein